MHVGIGARSWAVMNPSLYSQAFVNMSISEGTGEHVAIAWIMQLISAPSVQLALELELEVGQFYP